jgi:hypothetical protein
MRKDLTYMRREKGMQWRDIGEALGVSFSGCYKQFEYVENGKKNSEVRRWKKTEDNELIDLVSKEGATCWKSVAGAIAGRSRYSCRKRYSTLMKKSKVD